jgi:hypothetical protein
MTTKTTVTKEAKEKTVEKARVDSERTTTTTAIIGTARGTTRNEGIERSIIDETKMIGTKNERDDTVAARVVASYLWHIIGIVFFVGLPLSNVLGITSATCMQSLAGGSLPNVMTLINDIPGGMHLISEDATAAASDSVQPLNTVQ